MSNRKMEDRKPMVLVLAGPNVREKARLLHTLNKLDNIRMLMK